MRWCWLLVFILGLPSVSQAALVINEVAWMGTAASANDEWIELHNSGSQAISVDGWTLSDEMNLVINLSGSIPSGSYAVLERTDDESAPGTAFMVYVGALSNSGATLVLRNSSGNIQDQVSGGDGWENIGGDNVTKETAQYTSGGWITAAGTPGSVNNIEDTDTPELDEDGDVDENDVAVSASSNKSKDTNVQLTLAEKNLSLTLSAPEIVYVHQPVTFEVSANGLAKGLLESLSYQWNFGDMNIATGGLVDHTYLFPGTYVVTLTAEYARHAADIRHEVTVLPVAFSITRNRFGDIQINNDSKYEVDISGYAVKGKARKEFPKGSIVLANSTVTIPRSTLGDVAVYELFDQMNALVASTLPVQPALQAVSPPVVTTPAAPVLQQDTFESVSVDRNEAFSFGYTQEDIPVSSSEATSTAVVDTIPNTALVNQAAAPLSKNQLPLFGLIGLLVVCTLGLYASKVGTTDQS